MMGSVGSSVSPKDSIPRALFSRAISTTNNITCARPIPDLVGGPLYANSDITFHQLIIYICAPCLGLTIISAGYLALQHVRNYTVPQEQRQILRIIALPVFYSLFNFLALCWYRTYQYIQPLAGLYESFAIAALFFLLLEWVCPEGTDRTKYFDGFPFKDKKGVVIEGGSLAWFQVSTIHILRRRDSVQRTILTVDRTPGPRYSNTRWSHSSSQSSRLPRNTMANIARTPSLPNTPISGFSLRAFSSSLVHSKLPALSLEE
jgi:hypothetical protein